MSRMFVLFVCLVGCDLTLDGGPPPSNTLYFPTVLELGRDESGTPDYLYIVNSNFDRKYNSGSVLAVDLEQLKNEVDDATKEGGRCAEGDEDCLIEPAAVVADQVVVGSLGRGAALSSNGRRLYLANAIDPGVLTIEIDKSDGLSLQCGQVGRRCSDAFLSGDDGATNVTGEQVPQDPIDLIAGRLSDLSVEGGDTEYVMVAYRFGDIALFVADQAQDALVFTSVQRYLGNLTGLGYEPATHSVLISSASPTGNGTKQLQRVSVLVDVADPVNSALLSFPPLELQGIAESRSLWALQVVPEADDAAGRRRSTAFVVSQRPNALLTVSLDENAVSMANVDRTTPVGTGASRIALGTLGEPGSPDALELAIVSCFDERRLFVIDRKSGRALSIVSGFRGPFEVVMDEAREFLYVADFSASIVRIVSLRGLAGGQEARVIAILGHPKRVEELQ